MLFIKGTEIVGPKVPESFNVIVKELQGLGLKVDLLDTHADATIDAEAILASNIKEEAENAAVVDVPADELGNLDVTEESIENEFMTIGTSDELEADDTVTVPTNDDSEDNTETNDLNDEGEEA